MKHTGGKITRSRLRSRNRSYGKRLKRSLCRGKSRKICHATTGCKVVQGKSRSFCRRKRNKSRRHRRS